LIALLLEKKAIKMIDDRKRMVIYDDIEEYKKKYLMGVYQSLHPYYETEMPYIFWNALYEILLAQERKTH